MENHHSEARDSDNKFIDIDTGKVMVSPEPVILRIMAIGSCVAVAVYDRRKKIGGIAHVMLPGRSPESTSKEKTKYAEDAMDVLFDNLKSLDANMKGLEIYLVGGANILKEGVLPEKIIDSIIGYLKKLDITYCGKRVGGTERRSISLNIASGRIFYTEGNGEVKEL